MASASLENFLRHLSLTARSAELAQASDVELLDIYAADRDEAAFAELVSRHGRLVLSACRRVLGTSADAEDAFQATFAALAARAGVLRRESLAGWLHRVAIRTAGRLRSTAARREVQERRAGGLLEQLPADPTWDELKPILDAELDALPEPARLLLVGYYLEGRSYDDLAARLRLPRGSVGKRMDNARELLRHRLARRNIITSSIALAAWLTTASGERVSAGLLVTTVRTAHLFASSLAGVPPQVAGLAAWATLGSWGWGPITAFAAAGLLLVSMAVGAWWTMPAKPATTISSSRPAAPRPLPPPPPPHMDIALHGTVIHPDGRPCGNAMVVVLAGSWPRPGERERHDRVLADAHTDTEGRFQVMVPTVLDPHSPERRVKLLVAAEGAATFTHELLLGDKPAPLELQMSTGQDVTGRVVDSDGLPVAGVRIALASLGSVTRPHPVPSIWPADAMSDETGRFCFPQLPAAALGIVEVMDGRYAPTARTFTALKRADIPLVPARTITGVVVGDDTGHPLPFAWIDIQARNLKHNAITTLPDRTVQADAFGRFTIRPQPAAEYSVKVYPPRGEPYLSVERIVRWEAEDSTVEVPVALPRGVLIEGQARDAKTGDRVAGVHVQYLPRRHNAFARPDVLTGEETLVTAGADGRFSLTVPSGPGVVLVHTLADEGYVSHPFDMGELRGMKPTGRRVHAQAAVALDVPSGAERIPVVAELNPGVTISGTVLDSEGQPVTDGFVLCRSQVEPLRADVARRRAVSAGRFTLLGCVPGRVYPVLVMDTTGRQGAYAELVAGSRAEPVLRLAPCGTGRVRVVNAAGEPMPNTWAGKLVVLLEHDGPVGRPRLSGDPNHDGHKAHYFDLANYPRANAIRTNARGMATLTGLVPGVTYRMYHYAADGVTHVYGPEFRVGPGDDADLPDWMIRWPR